jgi:hypothetical protein
MSFSIDLEKNIINYYGIKISYNPETLEILKDEYDRLLEVK